MKITNRENNQDIVYIQQKNIKAIMKYENAIPNIFVTAIDPLNISKDYDSHDEEFVRLEGQDLVNYINSLDWIPDYRKLKKLSNDDINFLIEEIKTDLEKTTKKYLALPSDKKPLNNPLLRDRSKLNEQIKDLNALVWFRKNEYDQEIIIPTVLDGQALQFGIDDDKYTLGSSLDGTKLLLEKTDGTKYMNGDSVDLFDLQSAIAMYCIETGIITHQEGTGTGKQYLDETGKYFVTECTFTPTTDKKIEPDYLNLYKQSETTSKKSPLQKLKELFTKSKNTN